jgi:anti-sigma regulatory factor (Ser/Thr protein kinase)
MEVKINYIDIVFSIEFKGIEINVKNTHKKEIMYSLRQFITRIGATKSSWEDVNGAAKEFILNDFKKTQEHDDIVKRILNVL